MCILVGWSVNPLKDFKIWRLVGKPSERSSFKSEGWLMNLKDWDLTLKILSNVVQVIGVLKRPCIYNRSYVYFWPYVLPKYHLRQEMCWGAFPPPNSKTGMLYVQGWNWNFRSKERFIKFAPDHDSAQYMQMAEINCKFFICNAAIIPIFFSLAAI